MRKPEPLNAAQLRAALAQYGDLPVQIVLVDDEGNDITIPAYEIRLELAQTMDGRAVNITGYLSVEAGAVAREVQAIEDAEAVRRIAYRERPGGTP